MDFLEYAAIEVIDIVKATPAPFALRVIHHGEEQRHQVMGIVSVAMSVFTDTNDVTQRSIRQQTGIFGKHGDHALKRIALSDFLPRLFFEGMIELRQLKSSVFRNFDTVVVEHRCERRTLD